VEYDGAYWHADLVNTDREKTEILKNDGWDVIRVREKPLELISPTDVSVAVTLNAKPATDAVCQKYRVIVLCESVSYPLVTAKSQITVGLARILTWRLSDQLFVWARCDPKQTADSSTRLSARLCNQYSHGSLARRISLEGC